jgi:hypothetical protein
MGGRVETGSVVAESLKGDEDDEKAAWVVILLYD